MITLVNGKILVEKEIPKMEKEGIIYTDATVHKPAMGVVISTSRDVNEEIKVGKTAIFSQFAGSEIILNDKKYLILDKDDIWGLIND